MSRTSSTRSTRTATRRGFSAGSGDAGRGPKQCLTAGAMFRDVYNVPPCLHRLLLRGAESQADNPDIWMMLCHVDWHLDGGLAMIFVEGEAQLREAGVDAFSSSILSVCGSNFTGFSFDDSSVVTVP
ncbi:unnamed protein product [Phytophthora lilii]|uniref:Unnamed protein product n=1 Tax=Phytophthora lilii TaxID=2077276 RepID=A0A9W6U073_9STRA|nr:unnamed protein product [Phytophthora lilii]